ncbi:TRAP transporter small permease [Mesorhizobium microcysteis]|jgi:TRAP-type transport system small permease protein|uniref:TRAP transporter small permease protein n=1 Tax=Neoaquamicrobium microcysteis TaxID=2682781 RepID=A0A5D4GSH7_9HYPH|nr:TRAP transporter small permease subunit [Mesorhizobium microcysteis]TYR30689.1 TRAP transporter small permease [Mesorhizobium microcysteis]
MKALSILRTAERIAIVAIFLIMVALYFLNVVGRQFGGTLATNLAWIEEAVRLMSLFLVFLALGLALEKGRHVGVHTWRDGIAAATRLPVRRIIDAVGVIFSLYLAWLGYQMTVFVHSMGQTSPTLNMPIFWMYLAPTIGFILLALRYGLSFFGVIDRYSAQDKE